MAGDRANPHAQKRFATAAIIGAGPAGLTAAHFLAGSKMQVLVVEKSDKVGGLARTEVYKGYRFDIGGHRFYTKIGAVDALWRQMLGADFRRTQRLSRICYRNKFFHYPLEPWNTLVNLGGFESLRIGLSYLGSKIRPRRSEETFEDWVINRFGTRLYRTFFKAYTEKVWGMPCRQIRADWASQRIRGLSLPAALASAIFGAGHIHSLIRGFDYPLLGPGMMWERFRETLEQQGGEVLLESETSRLEHDGRQVTQMFVRRGKEHLQVTADHFLSTMPLAELIASLDPPPPGNILEAAQGLKQRDFILVGLIVRRTDLFPDNWLYLHSPEVKAGRIQNFKNWSPAMVSDSDKTSLGVEYFCSRGDPLWNRSDEQLICLATEEIVRLGLAAEQEVEDGVVIRQLNAYPVYDAGYRQRLALLRDYLAGFENLQTLGRGGLHRYNNQDHSMLTGLLAARNVLGEKQDVWNVNTDRSCYEEITA